MKKILSFLLALVAVTITSHAQDAITICHTPATEKFSMFASNKDFNANHQNPKVYVHTSEVGKMIKIKTSDGKEANAFFLKANKKTNNWIFVFQEWWGLNDNIKKEAEKLYHDLGNVNVLAPDMYDGKLATDAETAGKYMQEFKQARGTAIVEGALAFAGKDAKIGTIGWCFGGGQSLQATLTIGKQAAACVMYYGMPEEDVARLKTLNCDVLGIFGTEDKWINPTVVEKFETNMKAANKKVTVKNYHADHAFANPSNPQFKKEDTEDAYKASLAFFRARLK